MKKTISLNLLKKIICLILFVSVVSAGIQIGVSPAPLAETISSDAFQMFFIEAMSIQDDIRDDFVSEILMPIKTVSDVTPEKVTNSSLNYFKTLSKESIEESLIIYAKRSDESKGYITYLIGSGMKKIIYSTSGFPSIMATVNSELTGNPSDIRGLEFLVTLFSYASLSGPIAYDGIPESIIDFHYIGLDYIKDKVSSALELMVSLKQTVSQYPGQTNFDRLLSYSESLVNSHTEGEISAFKNFLGNYGIYKVGGVPPTPTPVPTTTPVSTATPVPTTIPELTPTPLPLSYTISGYIRPDFVFNGSVEAIIQSGFKVELIGTESKYHSLTDENGYFEITGVTQKIAESILEISKTNYLSRSLKIDSIASNIELSPQSDPIMVWAGDIDKSGVQDGAINLADIMEIAKIFNTSNSDQSFDTDLDLNKDGAINLSDIMIVAKHFNSTLKSYNN